MKNIYTVISGTISNSIAFQSTLGNSGVPLEYVKEIERDLDIVANCLPGINAKYKTYRIIKKCVSGRKISILSLYARINPSDGTANRGSFLACSVIIIGAIGDKYVPRIIEYIESVYSYIEEKYINRSTKSFDIKFSSLGAINIAYIDFPAITASEDICIQPPQNTSVPMYYLNLIGYIPNLNINDAMEYKGGLVELLRKLLKMQNYFDLVILSSETKIIINERTETFLKGESSQNTSTSIPSSGVSNDSSMQLNRLSTGQVGAQGLNVDTSRNDEVQVKNELNFHVDEITQHLAQLKHILSLNKAVDGSNSKPLPSQNKNKDVINEILDMFGSVKILIPIGVVLILLISGILTVSNKNPDKEGGGVKVQETTSSNNLSDYINNGKSFMVFLDKSNNQDEAGCGLTATDKSNFSSPLGNLRKGSMYRVTYTNKSWHVFGVNQGEKDCAEIEKAVSSKPEASPSSYELNLWGLPMKYNEQGIVYYKDEVVGHITKQEN